MLWQFFGCRRIITTACGLPRPLTKAEGWRGGGYWRRRRGLLRYRGARASTGSCRRSSACASNPPSSPACGDIVSQRSHARDSVKGCPGPGTRKRGYSIWPFGSRAIGGFSLWTASSDGSHQRRLTQDQANFSDWAPDGNRIASTSSMIRASISPRSRPLDGSGKP